MADAGGVVLYKHQEAWGLLSVSPACAQVEAYLRLSDTTFSVEHKHSPSGTMPAVEVGVHISPNEGDEYATARATIGLLSSKVKNLDEHLSHAQKAEALAFGVLAQSRLEPATSISMWCEQRGYSEYRKAAYGAQLPFPLSYIVPWRVRRDVLAKFGGLTADQAYAAAGAAVSAISDRLRASAAAAGCPCFFFGARPSALDAVLYGHLSFYRSSPAAAPVLRQQVSSLKVVTEYLDHVEKALAAAGPVAAPQPTPRGGAGGNASSSSTWSDAAKGQRNAPKPPPTAAELSFKRSSRLWLAGVGVALVAYVALSGSYIQVVQSAEALSALARSADDDDDGDDDDDDAGDE